MAEHEDFWFGVPRSRRFRIALGMFWAIHGRLTLQLSCGGCCCLFAADFLADEWLRFSGDLLCLEGASIPADGPAGA